MKLARASLALRLPPLGVSRADTVFIRELAVSTVIGVHEHERGTPRTLSMDLDIDLDDSAGGHTDRIADTVDYAAVVEAIRRTLATKRFFLLERVAEFVASVILDEFGAHSVRISVAKTGILEGVGRVGVSIERRRSRDALCVPFRRVAPIAKNKRRSGVSSISGK